MTLVTIVLLYGLSVPDYFIVGGSFFIYFGLMALQLSRISIGYFIFENGVVFGLIFLWSYYLHGRRNSIALLDAQSKKNQMDINILRDKYLARLENLKHLENQVGSLIDLFEVARDFNECLYFDQLVPVLKKKIHEQIQFKALTLSLIPEQVAGEELISKTVSIGRRDEETPIVKPASEFENICIRSIKENVRILKIETENDWLGLSPGSESTDFPLWIFPLCADEKAIGVLTIESANSNDFPKFELLASQLSLQAKKISLYERAKELSIIDGLTKVYVRRHFLERFEEELKRAIKRNTTLSVLMLDIDHFKRYNDQFGHLVGNSTLREVAAIIKEHIRKVDLVARYGGEEFIIVMPEICYPASVESAERIRSAIARKKFRLYDEETQVTVSVGVSSFPKNLDSQKVDDFKESLMFELIQKADKALYRSKEEGRNRVSSYEQVISQRRDE